MLKFTSIVGYTLCGPTYIESFLTIFGQCINVLNYNMGYGTAGGPMRLSKMAAILDFTITSYLSRKRGNCKYILLEL